MRHLIITATLAVASLGAQAASYSVVAHFTMEDKSILHLLSGGNPACPKGRETMLVGAKTGQTWRGCWDTTGIGMVHVRYGRDEYTYDAVELRFDSTDAPRGSQLRRDGVELTIEYTLGWIELGVRYPATTTPEGTKRWKDKLQSLQRERENWSAKP